MYRVWKTNADMKRIDKMDSEHIVNCINMIEKNMKFEGVKIGDSYVEDEEENNGILSHDWYVKYANGYLIAFKNELDKRNVKY